MKRAAVILPVRQASQTLLPTLQSLWPQCRRQGADLIVCVNQDDPSARLALSHPNLYTRLILDPQRSSVPQLRALGAKEARAEYIIITEDHCRFEDNWLGQLLAAADASGADVTGGGVANGRRGYAGWAQYFTRYASFAPPQSSGWTRSLPGNNACYRRAILEGNQEHLRDGFWEAELNAIIGSRNPFWRESGLDVIQCQVRGVFEYFALRFQHGRCYGARRWAEATGAERQRLALRSPMVPGVLFFRSARAVLVKPGLRWRFALVAPLLFGYQFAWSMGEWTGYLLGAGRSCDLTD